ncbi:hypothetical protein UFOVP929_13 [uncultured Caudovirales phage]|uniref:Holin n=1 Tax=uncultured Caudovirales phage TaxID=2100421 RepID=A0A6J5PIG4_9CAUD|nr:hypothetical protein UFOVP929_13 [uncultured Caudovirales phage]
MNLNPKIASAGIAGALTVVLVWIVGVLGIDVPAEVASAVTVIIAFAAGYMRPSGSWLPRD